MDIESIILGLSYLGIFIMMITNGIFSFPSSQLLYIVAGYFVSRGFISFEYTIIAGAIGNTIGNIALYEITREHGPKAALKFIPGAGTHLTNAEKYFAKKGAIFLFLGKLLPAIKVFVPIIGGISKTPRIIYATLILASSIIWGICFTSLGFYFGKSTTLYQSYVPALLFISAMLIVFFWYSYKKGTNNQKVSE